MSLLNTVIGHDREKHILLGSLKRGRVATTYLFTGESGIGKRLTALEFARAINCDNPVEEPRGLDACDNCGSCRKFSAFVHPDLKIVEAESSVIKIDTIREVQEFLSFRPYEGRKKVVIINDAECMNQSASNAFLKTLEEPPADSVIILITMSPDRLLDTIRSRCFRIRFLPLNRDECLMVIKQKLVDVDSETLEHLFGFSMGRPGLAIQGESSTTKDKLKGMVNGIFRGELSLQWSDRDEMEDWFNLFLIVLRDLMVLKITPAERGMLMNGWLEGKLLPLSKRVEIKDIMKLYDELIVLMGHFRFNLSASITSNYMKSLIVQALKPQCSAAN